MTEEGRDVWFSAPEKRVQEIAARKGLTLKELCSKAEIDPSTVRHWKSGRHEPRLDIVRKLERLSKSLPDKKQPKKIKNPQPRTIDLSRPEKENNEADHGT